MTNDIAKLITGPFQINTWIIPLSEKKALVIDPAACSLTQDQYKITSFLQENNLEPAAILLTHGHFDHIMGTGVLKKAFPNAPLVCHSADAAMAGPSASQVQAPALCAMGLDVLSEGLQELPAPDVTSNSDISLYELLKGLSYDEETITALKEWKILCTPGHTEGSVCYYNKNRGLLFSGDTIFYHSYGRTDLPGGSDAKIAKSLNRIYSTLPENTLVFPGHETAGFPLKENL